ncbi:Lactate-binding periplasmic protein [subsurface metagenome]
MSNGRLDIEYFDGGVLVDNIEAFDALSEGVLDLMVDASFYRTGIMPVQGLVYGYPGCYRNLGECLVYLHQFGMADILRQAYADHNIYYLGVEPDAGVSILSKKPLRSIDDLEGLKMRVGGGAGSTLGDAGVAVVSVGAAELYTSLSTGIIDSVVYGGIAVADRLKLQETAKYWMMPYLLGSHMVNVFLVNMDTWNALPNDLKAILQGAYLAVESNLYRADYHLDRVVGKEWQTEYGVEMINFPQEDQDKLAAYSMERLNELAASDPIAAKAVEALKQMWAVMR